jgi:hypothetical protein
MEREKAVKGAFKKWCAYFFASVECIDAFSSTFEPFISL